VNPETNASPIQTTSLISSAETAPVFPQLDRFSKSFARFFGEYAVQIGAGEARVLPLEVVVKPFGAWREEGGAGLAALCRYQLNPVKGAALLRIPETLVRQLVDRFYGGNGDLGPDRVTFSTAELTFIARQAEDCATMLAEAWADIVPMTVELNRVATDWTDVDFVRADDLIVVQPFTVTGVGVTPSIFEMAYPLDALRTVGQRDAPAHAETQSPGDDDWRLRLTTAVLDTRLPLRMIFAKAEMPFVQVLNLKPGDVIPLNVSTHMPVIVGETRFALGTLGEANGRVAVQIQTTKGNSHE
jgi:flagellar motor switch protein FliM